MNADFTETVVLSTPTEINFFRMASLKGALKLEIAGLKRRGRSAYAIIKTETGWKGSRAKILAKITHWVDFEIVKKQTLACPTSYLESVVLETEQAGADSFKFEGKGPSYSIELVKEIIQARAK